MLLDALDRHRGKGQQKVTVEHVHVHSGGHRGEIGTRDLIRSEDQHAETSYNKCDQSL